MAYVLSKEKGVIKITIKITHILSNYSLSSSLLGRIEKMRGIPSA